MINNQLKMRNNGNTMNVDERKPTIFVIFVIPWQIK